MSCARKPEHSLVIPVHHSGLFRYPTPSPTTPPFWDCSSPFFLKTKLVPMSTPDAIARMMPTILNDVNRACTPGWSYGRTFKFPGAFRVAAADVAANGLALVDEEGDTDEEAILRSLL